MAVARWLAAASRWFYILAAKAYPRSFRRAHGVELVEVFDAMVDDASRQRGVLGIAGVWRRVLPDLAVTLAQQHALELQRRLAVTRIFSDPVYLVPALAVAMFIGMVTTPPDPLTMFVIGWPVYGLYLCGFVSTRLIRRAHPLALVLGALNAALWGGGMMLLAALVRTGQLEIAPQRWFSAIVPGLLVLPPITTAMVVGVVFLVLRRGRAMCGTEHR